MKNPYSLAILGAALCLPLLAHAESAFSTAASGATTASARLDFRLKIAKVLFLRVGNGANSLANNTSVDLIDFDVAAANLGTGASQSASGGDLGGGSVIVALFANGGSSATLNSSTTGQLSNGAGDTIPWTEIVATPATLPFAVPSPLVNTAIAHPTFNNTAGGGNGTQVTVAGSDGIVGVAGRWTFTYANSQPVAAGTYGGANTQNGRVTYTATQP